MDDLDNPAPTRPAYRQHNSYRHFCTACGSWHAAKTLGLITPPCLDYNETIKTGVILVAADDFNADVARKGSRNST
jgi:hypothetical protein